MADDTIIPPSGGDSHLRKAHFLKPSVNGPVTAPSPACSDGSCKGLPLKVNYVGWGYHPLQKWKEWVDAMCISHHSTWERAGILGAIKSSTCFIHRQEDLILGLVEKWSPATNSFVFPWGEATVTLEDMMVLGGYSVLGDSVFVPWDGEVEEKVTKLLESLLEIYSSGDKRAFHTRWIAQLMGSGTEMEKEAFLAFWLSKFVFPFSSKAARTSTTVLAIAVCLARGTRIALAPAVLASIYKGLTILKAAVAKPVRKRAAVAVSAPLALVQVWAWERFPALRPSPRWIGANEPRIARWSGFKHGSCRDWRPALDSGGEGFQWRPYSRTGAGVYTDNERWEIVEGGLDEEVQSYVRCVRASKIVGVEEDCVELYLPNRVSMQFGIDQDLPGHVGEDNVDYFRPIRDAKLYVPSRFSQPCVTSRYFDWWKKLHFDEQAMATDVTDADFMPRQRHSTRAANNAKLARVAKRHSWHASLSCNQTYGRKGSFKRTKRKYLEQFRRQRIRVKPGPQRVAPRHSSASNTKAAFGGKESSSESSKKEFVECLSGVISDHIASVSPTCTPKCYPMETSDLGSQLQTKVTEPSVSEIDGNHLPQGENCSCPEVRNENVPSVCEIGGNHQAQGQNFLFSEARDENVPTVCEIAGNHQGGENCLFSEARNENVPSVCEIEENYQAQAENCLSSETRNEDVPQVMLSVEAEAKSSQTEQISDAVIVGPDEMIGRAQQCFAALERCEERARNLKKILRLIQAGKLVCLPKTSL